MDASNHSLFDSQMGPYFLIIGCANPAPPCPISQAMASYATQQHHNFLPSARHLSRFLKGIDNYIPDSFLSYQKGLCVMEGIFNIYHFNEHQSSKRNHILVFRLCHRTSQQSSLQYSIHPLP